MGQFCMPLNTVKEMEHDISNEAIWPKGEFF